jgi:Family of unknown function (DUF5681)
MSNPNIAQAGIATRWQPGQSANPGGKPRMTSLTRKMRDLLDQSADVLEAVRVIEMAEGPAAVERYDVEALNNSDLVVRAVLGIALNRTGRVPAAVQLAAAELIWNRMDGKVSDEVKPVDADEETDARAAMTIREFRAAVFGPAPGQEAPTSPGDIAPRDGRGD